MAARVVVLISGGGSNLEALLENLPASGVPAEVVAVGSDTDAPGLEHARTRSIPSFIERLSDYPDRDAWGAALAEAIWSHRPDWVVLSGFMRLLPARVLDRFPQRIINTHPSFLPEFPGAHAVADALAAGADQTGASVILVDSGVDTGPILAQERVAIGPGESEHALHERIKLVERRLLLEVLAELVSEGGSR